jgi:hypothetical protein
MSMACAGSRSAGHPGHRYCGPVAGEPVRRKFSAAQVELLREVLANAPPAVIETGERMARGEVVQRFDAEES